MFASWAGLVSEDAGFMLVVGGTIAGLVGFVAQCLSVRCPRCRAAVVWHTFNTRNASEAGLVAAYQATCPRCGYEPKE